MARLLVSTVFMGAAVAMLYVLPKLIGSSSTEVWARLGQIGLGTGLVILGLWIGGLAVYTIAMTASMPGLSHRKALALNLAGSSASNLLPFGGVIGTGVNLAMVRSWRLSVRGFASSTAVLNVVNLVAKLLLPAIAGIALGSQRAAAPWLVHSARVATVVAGVVIVGMAVALFSPAWARKVDAALRYLVGRAGGRGKKAVRATDESGRGPVETLQWQVRGVFRSRWIGLSFGMIGYILLQWALFWVCLNAVDVGANPAAVFAAFAVERALTLAVVTPSGAGVAEVAAAGLLVALGFSPASSAAGVLLYRLMVYLAEIPVGAAVLGTWASMRLVRRRQDEAQALRENAQADAGQPRPTGDASSTASAVPAPSSIPAPEPRPGLPAPAVGSASAARPDSSPRPERPERALAGPAVPLRQLDSGVAVNARPTPSTVAPPRASNRK